MNISILANKKKDSDGKILNMILNSLKGRANVSVFDEFFGKEVYRASDIVIVLGGDGTIINVAKAAAVYGVPVCGINMGKVGFLATAEINEIHTAMERILSGSYKIEKRMMLEVVIKSENGLSEKMMVLNDIAIGRGAYPKMIELKLTDDSDFLDSYLADGIIISTPTGSTAYSLSAGGPVAAPTMELMLLTPICAFDLQTRSMVLPADRELTVAVGGRVTANASLSVDGQTDIQVRPKDRIIIKKSAYYAQLISIGNRSFYGVLRKKLGRKAD